MFKAQLSVDIGLIHCKTQDASIWKQANTVPFYMPWDRSSHRHMFMILFFFFFSLACTMGSTFFLPQASSGFFFHQNIIKLLLIRWLIEYGLIMALYFKYMFLHTVSSILVLIRGLKNWGAICRFTLSEGWIIQMAHSTTQSQTLMYLTTYFYLIVNIKNIDINWMFSIR